MSLRQRSYLTEEKGRYSGLNAESMKSLKGYAAKLKTSHPATARARDEYSAQAKRAPVDWASEKLDVMYFSDMVVGIAKQLQKGKSVSDGWIKEKVAKLTGKKPQAPNRRAIKSLVAVAKLVRDDLATVMKAAGGVSESTGGARKYPQGRTVKAALRKAGIDAKVTGRQLGMEVEVEGKVHSKALKILRALYKKLGISDGWGGYKTGYGAWVLRPRYEADDLDYGNKASRHHY